MPPPQINQMVSMAKSKVQTLLAGNSNAPKAVAYVEKVSKAIGSAWNAWRLQAKFRNIKINGSIATGSIGCLDGPKWESLIKAEAPQLDAWEKGLTNAIASGLSESWYDYQSHVTVPNLPWYPAFVGWPGPQAGPMPNVPTPLLAAPSSKASQLDSGTLKNKITMKAVGSPASLSQVAESVSFAFASVFGLWLPTQMITNVMGKGPVPAFAPPIVLAGPVVNGDIISVPGHLMS